MNAPFEFFGSPEGANSEELRARLQRLEALISHAPVPIAIAHDAGCLVISANAALSELLGVPAGENISLTPPPGEQPRYQIQRDGKDIPTDQLPMQYAIAHRTRIRNDIEILRADGSVRYIQNDVEPIYDAGGEVSGCISVCVDLTEQRRAERLLLEADRTKDEFLAILSHELRNPLAPIRNALGVIRRSGEDPIVARRAYAVIERQVNQLVRLTDDLLDVSRITRDQIDLRREPTDLRLVLHSAVETSQPLIDAAGHILTFEVPHDPVWVDADPARMTQAFANLLNNAVKYTDRGGRITIHGSVDGAQATVSVADTGIGIAPEVLPRIFDLFTRSDDSPNRIREGLGIGLTLAKRLIELHGGTIEAASGGPGRGTTFVTRLPMAAPSIVTPAG